jgi:hypothetical protein
VRCDQGSYALAILEPLNSARSYSREFAGFIRRIMNTQPTFTVRELSTVLAALRAWQAAPAATRYNSKFTDIATDNDTFAIPLEDDEIDALCERLNA